MSIADNLESKIAKGELDPPISPWLVKLNRSLVWGTLGFFISLGALSAGIAVWFALDPHDIAESSRTSGVLSNFLEALPLFWGGVSMVCGFLAIKLFSKADRGYRYRLVTVTLTCLVAFVALGAALASAGLADEIDRLAAELVPNYANLAVPHAMKYLDPQNGNWVGRVDGVSTSSILLEDLNGQLWNVTFMQRRPVSNGDCVRVIGTMDSATSQTVTAVSIGSCPHGVRFILPDRGLK